MLFRIVKTFWGDFSKEESTKFLYLSLAAFFVIGAQWPLKILKDCLVLGEVGAQYQPIYKIITIGICFPLALGYGFLVNNFRRENVIYFTIGFVTFFGILFWYLLSSNITFIPKPYLVGGFYMYAEMFTVMTITPFWAFVNDLTTPAEAKRGYGIIVFASQLGGLIFTILSDVASRYELSSAFVSSVSTVTLLLFGLSIWLVTHKVRRSELEGYSSEKKAVEEKHSISFLRGLALLAASPYVAGIFFLTVSQEVIQSVLYFGFLQAIGTHYAGNKVAMHIFMNDYALWVQIVATIFSLIGTSYFQRKLGVRFCLVAYPVMVLVCALWMGVYPTLFAATFTMIAIRGMHYALNKPTREILYIPTTKEVKYKSKAWIEMFGTRISKTAGSLLNKYSASSGLIAIAISLVWVLVARFVGERYHDSVEQDKTVV